MAPRRPKAATVPTPVARTAPGYTCAASANIVVWTPLIRPPRMVSRAMMGHVPVAGVIVIWLNTTAESTAPAAIDNIDTREPTRAIAKPPRSAPTTPPRLNAVIPVLAVEVVNPALLSSDVNQLKPQ